MVSISLNNVSKVYAGKEQALCNFSLEIGCGEFIVLLGPEGCGKTTVLRIIAGLESASEGELRIGGRLMSGLGAKDRNIAMVFQGNALFENKTVYDNLAYGLALRGTPDGTVKERVAEAAAFWGLTDVLGRKTKGLSRALLRRAAVARAALRRPDILLLDAPLSGLDEKPRLQTLMDIAKLRRRLPATFVYATSDPSEAAATGARVAVMDGGRLLRAVSAKELREAFADE